jgi:hypothetical protein
MSVVLAANFAAALHQVNASGADPEAMEEAITLLTRAANGKPVSFETLENKLYVNDVPLPATAPGVSHVIKALDDHGTTRLALPAKLEPRHWREITEVFASVAALYPTADDIRDALRASVPAAVVSSRKQEPGFTDLREAMFEMPGLMTDAGAAATVAADGLTTRTTDRSELSARLDPILKDAESAVNARDYEQLARLMLEVAAIGEQSDEATRTIISRERRRMAPQSVLSMMVRLVPRPETSPVITKAIMSMGRDGVEALIDAMSGASSGFERRAYIEALTASRDADEAILASLGSARAELVRDAADVAGRRRMDSAVGTLGHLLKHNDERVRTAAWQALERIGTGEALDALYGQPTAGRSR